MRGPLPVGPAGGAESAARVGSVQRNTLETKISLRLNVDGTGQYRVSTGIRFFDHMLESFAKHGGFDLDLTCKGDLDVDQHHTVEDVGIALGEAFGEALGDKRGILRAGVLLHGDGRDTGGVGGGPFGPRGVRGRRPAHTAAGG